MKTIQRSSPQSALLLATLALVANFWAWSLLGPLASHYQDLLHLSLSRVSFLVAVPVIMGSLGRVLLGVLADRYGGYRVFSVLCFVSAVPVLALTLSHGYVQLIATAFFLGIAGASFAAGIPFINAWFPPGRRGLALGIYGMGNFGTAISGFLTPRILDRYGDLAFMLPAGVLIAMGIAFLLLGADAPEWKASKVSSASQLRRAALLPMTRYLALLYAISFGGFTAFGVYLPTMLKTAYSLGIADAAARAAGFVVLATLSRPVGGWLSDRLGGTVVLKGVFSAIAVLAVIVALNPPLMLSGTLAYLTLAATLGCGNGAVFAILGRNVEPRLIGSVTGIVGAVGGLGGFLPPLLMGLTYQHMHSYSLPLSLLAAVSVVVYLYASHGLKRAGVGSTN